MSLTHTNHSSFGTLLDLRLADTGQMTKNRQKQAWIFGAKSKVDLWRFATDSQIGKNSQEQAKIGRLICKYALLFAPKSIADFWRFFFIRRVVNSMNKQEFKIYMEKCRVSQSLQPIIEQYQNCFFFLKIYVSKNKLQYK